MVKIRGAGEIKHRGRHSCSSDLTKVPVVRGCWGHATDSDPTRTRLWSGPASNPSGSFCELAKTIAQSCVTTPCCEILLLSFLSRPATLQCLKLSRDHWHRPEHERKRERQQEKMMTLRVWKSTPWGCIPMFACVNTTRRIEMWRSCSEWRCLSSSVYCDNS